MHRTENVSTTDEAENVREKKIDIPIVDNTDARAQLVARIESVAADIIRQICSGQLPKVSYTARHSDTLRDFGMVEENYLDECSENFESNRSSSASSSSSQVSLTAADRTNRDNKVVTNFASKFGKNKLALTVTVMAAAQRLLITNNTCTRRAFYYDLKTEKTMNLAPSQRYVDDSVNHAASILNCTPWDLHFTASSKGLAAGELSLSLTDNRTVDCTVPGGALIPQIASNVRSVRAKANFVLIVEKDAVFQKLLEQNCTRHFNCILLTGKGYPDVATRMLVKLLSEKMALPIYVIADADPFGVEIVCVYRFGSTSLHKKNDCLACSNVRWLGIFPSELVALGVKTLPLTERDLARLMAIEKRPYMNEAFLRELRIMRKGKAEIEAILSFAKNFFVTTYLSCKITGNDFL